MRGVNPIILAAIFIIMFACSSDTIWKYKVKVTDKKGQPVTATEAKVHVENISFSSTPNAEIGTQREVHGMKINFKFFDEVSGLPLDVPLDNIKVSSDISMKSDLTKSEGKIVLNPGDLLLYVEVNETEIWERYEDEVHIRMGQSVAVVKGSLSPKRILLKISGRCIDKDGLEDLAGCKIEVFSKGAKEPFVRYLSSEKGVFDFIVSRPLKMDCCEVKITKEGYKSFERSYRPPEKVKKKEVELRLGIITLEHDKKVVPPKKRVTGIPEGSIRLAGKVLDPGGNGIGHAQVVLSIYKKGLEEVYLYMTKTDPSGRFLGYISIPQYLSSEPLKYYVKVVPKDQTRFEINERTYERSDFSREIKISLRKAGRPYLRGSVQNLPTMIEGAKLLLYWGEDVKRYEAIPDKSKIESIFPFDLTYVDENGDFTFISAEKIKPGEYGLLLRVKNRITWFYPRSIRIGDEVKRNLILDVPKGYFHQKSNIKVVGEKAQRTLPIEARFILKDAFKGLIPVPLPRKALGMVDLMDIPVNAIEKIHLIPKEEGFFGATLTVTEIPEYKKVVLARAKKKDLVIIWLPYAKVTDAKRKVSPSREKVMHIGDILSSSDNHWRRWYVVGHKIVIPDSQWKEKKKELLDVSILRGPLINLPYFMGTRTLQPFVERYGKDLANVQVLLILDAEALPNQSPSSIPDSTLGVFNGLNLSRFSILLYSHYYKPEDIPPILKKHIQRIIKLGPKDRSEYHLIHLNEDEKERQTLKVGYHLPRLWWYSD